jgi:hypothetical protein
VFGAEEKRVAKQNINEQIRKTVKNFGHLRPSIKSKACILCFAARRKNTGYHTGSAIKQ